MLELLVVLVGAMSIDKLGLLYPWMLDDHV